MEQARTVELKNIGGHICQILHAISIVGSGGRVLKGVATKPESLTTCEQEVRRYWSGEIQHGEMAILTDRVLNAGEKIFARYVGFERVAYTLVGVCVAERVEEKLRSDYESREDYDADSWVEEFTLL